MTLEALKTLLNRRPFEPLRITMSSGQVFELRHPEMAALSRNYMLVIIPDEQGGPTDRWEYLAYLHIAHVETLSPSGRAV